MSGRFNFSIGENGPYIDFGVTIDDKRERQTVTWENTVLFTHAYKWQHIDHMYIGQPEEEDRERQLGIFVFRYLLPDFNDLVNGLVVHDFPHIHMPEPSEYDLSVYNRLKPKELPKPSLQDEEDAIVREAMAKIDDEIDYIEGEEL